MIPILDNGHGGMIDGVYQTAGKRSPDWEFGVLYEGAFNRWIINSLMERLDYLKIPYYHVSPELTDISLGVRVERANRIVEDNFYTYLFSLHANAGGGTGWEIFTSPGETRSDFLADVFISTIEESSSELSFTKARYDTSDGDKDKEANFYLLRKTHCPAVLFECGFMDNKEDYKRLWDKSFRDSIVDDLVTAIENIFKHSTTEWSAYHF